MSQSNNMVKLALGMAAKAIGSCSKRAVSIAPPNQTVRHAELQIGLGNAGDWVAWASGLRKLDFKSARKRKSPRAVSFCEATRFTYAWTAANSLFSRDQVMRHLHKTALPSGEFDRFLLMYRYCGISTNDETTLLHILHATLASVRTPNEFPWAPLPTVRIVDLIYYKYTPDPYKAIGKAAKAIKGVVENGDAITSLDLPTLIYAARNWTVHGALVDSSFRGAPAQYQLYMVTITKALAIVIGGFAAALEGAL